MRKIFHRFFTIVSIVFVGLLLVDVARACSCATSPLNWEVENSANIVILKLQSVEKYKNGEEGYGEDGIKQSKLIVQKVFKGNFKIGKVMTFEQGGGADCIWGFNQKSVGKKFLFFLSKTSFEPFLWRGNVCSRSDFLESAGADLLYLEKFKKVIGKTRLSGVIFNVTEKKTDTKKPWREFNYEPIAGRKIRVVGKGVDVTLKTNKNGAYEIYDLPVGKYRLIPQEVKGYRSNIPFNETDEVEIKAHSLVEQNIEYLVD